MGSWAVAQSPILGTTITLDRLCKRGYESMLSVYENIAPHLNEPSRRRRDGVRGSPHQLSLVGQPTRLPSGVLVMPFLLVCVQGSQFVIHCLQVWHLKGCKSVLVHFCLLYKSYK